MLRCRQLTIVSDFTDIKPPSNWPKLKDIGSFSHRDLRVSIPLLYFGVGANCHLRKIVIADFYRRGVRFRP